MNFMTNLFTSVQKNAKESTGFISRVLRLNPKNDNSRAICTTVIRDIAFHKTGKYYVYVILCEGNSLYIGQTNNLQARWEQHHQGKGASWTKTHAPIKIVHFEELDTLREAVKREKDLKTGFGRKWLKKLIDSRLPAASPARAQACGPRRRQVRFAPWLFVI